jgi:hypothetical protein
MFLKCDCAGHNDLRKKPLTLRLLAEFFEMDDLHISCAIPPAYVLFRRGNLKRPEFEDLEAAVILVFPLERSITIKGYSV